MKRALFLLAWGLAAIAWGDGAQRLLLQSKKNGQKSGGLLLFDCDSGSKERAGATLLPNRVYWKDNHPVLTDSQARFNPGEWLMPTTILPGRFLGCHQTLVHRILDSKGDWKVTDKPERRLVNLGNNEVRRENYVRYVDFLRYK